MQFSVRYVLLFSAAICGVCAVFVSSLAVGLRERQEVNALLFKQRNVLEAAGLLEGEEATAERITQLFGQRVDSVVIALETGETMADIDPASFDQQLEKKDPATSRQAPKNNAGVNRVPNHAQVFRVKDDAGSIAMYILPIEGYGLWTTLYGFIALDQDLNTVRGLTYYEHGETPGLGGEVDNPNWKAAWPGRKVFGDDGEPKIAVIKGVAPGPEEAPYEVDGLSGATITARGVTNMLHFWLGDNGFGPYLEKVRETRGAA